MSVNNNDSQDSIKEHYTTPYICKHLSIKPGRLREWIIEDWIVPTVSAQRQGRGAKFTIFDVYCVELFRVLLTRKIGRETAGEIIKLWKKYNKNKEESELDFIIIKQLDQEGKKPQIVITHTSSQKLKKHNFDARLDFNMFDEKGYHYRDWDSVYIFNNKKIIQRVNDLLRE